MKNIKVIGALYVTFIAILLIMWVLKVIAQLQVLQYTKQGFLIAVIFIVLGFIFDALSPKEKK